jgi:translation initiation factor IF-3
VVLATASFFIGGTDNKGPGVRPGEVQRNIADTVRINEKIRADTVRLIGADGEQVGVIGLRQALDYADRLNLDLVEVAPMANPPVVKVMDYGKYRYEQEQKAKEARKRQTTISIKEIKLRPKIDDHDFDTKKGHVERFLKKGDKVKLTIMFRGRELVHPHLGEVLLRRMAEELGELGEVESEPNLDGRNMVMMIAPRKR